MESEFRKDLVSGDWVLIASGRNRRPHTIRPRENNYQKPENCPFENRGNGAVAVVPNDFPAVAQGICSPMENRDGYQIANGIGIHELVIMRDHNKFLHDFSIAEVAEVFRVYREEYKRIMVPENCAQYIMIFNNYGREGGASIYHPHSQIISVPIIPPDVMRSLRGSYEYFREHGKEAHALMMEKEIANQKRLVFENEQFVAFCPFVSKQPYEIRIYPKFASGHFENLEDESLEPLGEALTSILKKIHKNMGDPAYNFFIHTAPLHFPPAGWAGEHKDFSADQYYRWHIEIVPRVSFDAGFEVGTGIKINIVDPDYAAETLNAASP